MRWRTKRGAAFLAALLVLAQAGCKGKAAEELGIRIEPKLKKLSNGLAVILVEDHTVPIVSYQTWFRVGSVDEAPGITGISHLFEHLMFKGTPKFGPKEFFRRLEAKGAEVNAFTTRDYTAYYENFTPGLLPQVIEMEADRMMNLTLTEDVLASERQVVMEERRMRTDNSPEGRMQEALWGLAFRYHPYRWPVIGDPADLASIRLEEVKKYYQTHYAPSSAAVVVVGDIDPAATFAAIQKNYGSLPSVTAPKREVTAEPEQKEERRMTLYDEVSAERFGFAYRITSAHENDSFALDVLANILFDGTSSRAYRLLVEEKNVALGVGGAAFTPAYPGLFLINGTMKNGASSDQAEKLLDEAIREVQEKGVSEEEIRIAIRQLTIQLVNSVRTPNGLGNVLGTIYTVFGNLDRFEGEVERYLKVTPADVRRVAQKYLVPNNRTVVVLVPKRTADGSKGRSG